MAVSERASESPHVVTHEPDIVRWTNVVLPGAYAWLTTVVHPVLGRGAPWSARILALVAGCALVAGALLRSRPRWQRYLGLHAFVGATLGVWCLAGSRIDVQKLDPVQGALGALGWALFAFGWGAVRRVGYVPESDPRVLPGDVLPSRGELPPFALAVTGFAVAAALVPLTLAYRVARRDQALMAHAVAVVAAVALVSAGARIATESGHFRPAPSRERLARAMPALAAVGVGLLVGAVALFTR